MNILITNDDGYQAKGIRILANIMKKYGTVEVLAPKKHESGMSMALTMGLKQIAFKELGMRDGIKWSYLDATPASCIKFGFNEVYSTTKPDVVLSGINHGFNAASAACYSGTLGAAAEAAIKDTAAIGVSLDTHSPDADFSMVEKFLPEIFEKLMANYPIGKGIYYNINFPDLPADKIKGIKVGYQGKGDWIKEFGEWNPKVLEHLGITPEYLGQSSLPKVEEGEKLYMMLGKFSSDPSNTPNADHLLLEEGYISIVAHKIDCTDYEQMERIKDLF